jgi:hypothetical protein
MRELQRGTVDIPAFLQSLCDGDHDDDDLSDAEWDPHHMPLPIPAKKKSNKGTHNKNVGDHPLYSYSP